MDLMALADCAAAAGGRPGPGDRAAEPAVRLRPTTNCSLWLGVATACCARLSREKAGERGFRRSRAALLGDCAGGAAARRRSASLPAARRRCGGRADFLARLGPKRTTRSTNSSISRSTYERRETPSLQGFLAWLRGRKSEVKRDMEMARDEVRVMTVHGAKGLEAPMVFLADTTTHRSAGAHPPRLLGFPNGAGSGRRRKDDDARRWRMRARPRSKAARDEYRRPLYVAMTRAAERLIVCGAQGATKSRTAAGTTGARRARRPMRRASRPTTATAKCCAIKRPPAEAAPVARASPPAPAIATASWLARTPPRNCRRRGDHALHRRSRTNAGRPPRPGGDRHWGCCAARWSTG